jgi:hypothetical protein
MESIGVYIHIGGALHESLINEFVQLAIDEISFYDDFNSDFVREADGQSLLLEGTADYGLCKDIHAFCIEHGLSFKHTCEAKDEYNADMTYWHPGMEDPETFMIGSNEESVIRVAQIKPLMKFMSALIADGMEALPKNLDDQDEAIQRLVKIGLDSGKETLLVEINKYFESLYPPEDFEVPTFTIIKE